MTSLTRLLTPEREEVLRLLKTDFPYFARTCLKIKTKDGRILPLALNAAQQYIHQMIEGQLARTGKVRAIILKGRQQGASTYTEARYYWRTSMNTGKTAYILTHEDKATQNIFGMARRYHDLMPDPMRPATSSANANELAFSARQSKYMVGTAGSRGTGRSSTVQYFHGSEMAFWPNAADHLAGVGQAVPDLPGTEIILESTANGIGNPFHSMWQDAIRGRGQYIAIFVPWFWQPEYTADVPEDFALDADEADYADLHGLTPGQMAWRRHKLTDDFRGDVGLFDQEYPATQALAFRKSTENSLITLQSVERAMVAILEPDDGAPRIMGVDPAEYGDDDTAIALRSGRVVESMERHHGRGPMEVVGLVATRADALRPVAINIDCTGIGSGIADRLLELGYPVNRVHFGERAIEAEQYAIRRDEMWGEMARWFEDAPNRIPADDVLAADLTGPTYTYDSSRRLKLERKEDMKRRGLSSPDSADAMALTFAVRIGRPRRPTTADRRYNWKAG